MWGAALGLVLVASARPVAAQLRLEPSDGRFWAGAAALLAAAAAQDAQLLDAAARNPGTLVSRAADLVEPVGRERYGIRGLTGAWVITRLAGRTRASRAVLRIAAGYLVADVIESSLKWTVGRHRPDTLGGGAWRFRGLRGEADWHAMPSGHTTHAFALAAAVADEARRPAVTLAAYGVAALVGWQRLASRSHWPSDVLAGAVIGVASAQTTGRWLRRGLLRDPGASEPATASTAVRMWVAPRSVAVSVAISLSRLTLLPSPHVTH